MLSIRCVVCGAEREMPAARTGRPRIPRGWKLLREQAYCPTCKQRAYALRALMLPVVGPEGRTWAELREELRPVWSETTRCANWVVTELYSRDVRRGPHDERLPPMPHIYLYPEARTLFPRLPAQAVAALIQDVLRRYRASRHALLWSRRTSLASYRYPVALTLPRQAWSLLEEQGRWAVSLRLSDARWSLRLRGGPAMRRQLARLRQLVTGEAERASLSIYEAHDVVMIKIAAWLPRTAPAGQAAPVLVHTDEQSLLATEPRWRIDPTPLHQVLAADARRRASLVANLKVTRTSRGRTDRIERALNALSRRTRQRLIDACRTSAAHLAAHLVARDVRAVRYDDRVRPALAHFPWGLLRTRVAQKLDEHGIGFVAVAGADPAALFGERDDEHAA